MPNYSNDFRLENALSSSDIDPEDETALKSLRQLLRSMDSSPVPYAVILKADGDRMGKLLSSAKSAEDSRNISKALHGFASRVRGIVREHRGHAIYSGGDDVLALVPLPNAIECARALKEDFVHQLAEIANKLVNSGDQPTLSVGLGIGHLMEPLGSLRNRADRAERAAKGNGLGEKQERNALAIALGIRSGGEHHWRAKWTDTSAFDALKRFTDAFRQQELPSRIAYDLRAIDLRLAWLRNQYDDVARGMRDSEVSRMLDRARTEGGNRQISSTLRDLIILRIAKGQSLESLAETLIIARWLSARTAADLGVSK